MMCSPSPLCVCLGHPKVSTRLGRDPPTAPSAGHQAAVLWFGLIWSVTYRYTDGESSSKAKYLQEP
eukprot:4143859-Amphidinium_carterae.1